MKCLSLLVILLESLVLRTTAQVVAFAFSGAFPPRPDCRSRSCCHNNSSRPRFWTPKYLKLTHSIEQIYPRHSWCPLRYR
jgi:hypothetical protein